METEIQTATMLLTVKTEMELQTIKAATENITQLQIEFKQTLDEIYFKHNHPIKHSEFYLKQQ